jgi:ABC-type transporter Mla MlaB component
MSFGIVRRPTVQMAEPRPSTIVCDVGGVAVDATTVDALARLQLAARRLGHDVLLSDVPSELVELLELCGLRDVLRLEVRGQPEERE